MRWSDFVSLIIWRSLFFSGNFVTSFKNDIISMENMKTMKKKLLFIGLFLVVAIAASFQFNTEKDGLESLMLENIDALASGEWGSDARCVGSGSVDCPGSHVKVYLIMGPYSLEGLN